MRLKKFWKFIFSLVDTAFLYGGVIARMVFSIAALAIFAIKFEVPNWIAIGLTLWVLGPIWNKIRQKVKNSIGWYSND